MLSQLQDRRKPENAFHQFSWFGLFFSPISLLIVAEILWIPSENQMIKSFYSDFASTVAHSVRSISIRWFNKLLFLSRLALDVRFHPLTFEGQFDGCDRRNSFTGDYVIHSTRRFSVAMLSHWCSEWLFKTFWEGRNQPPKSAPDWNRQYNWEKTWRQLVLLLKNKSQQKWC